MKKPKTHKVLSPLLLSATTKRCKFFYNVLETHSIVVDHYNIIDF